MGKEHNKNEWLNRTSSSNYLFTFLPRSIFSTRAVILFEVEPSIVSPRHGLIWK